MCLLCTIYGGGGFDIDTDLDIFSPMRTFPVRCAICPQAPTITLDINGILIHSIFVSFLYYFLWVNVFYFLHFSYK
jgi:hypothetical protein